MTPYFEDKCLVCHKTGGNLNIFATYNICNEKEELYVEVIKNCFNIEIDQDTGLNAMCTDCSIKLRRAYNFKNDIIEALHNLVTSQVTDATVEKEYSQIDYLNNRFESDYDINTVLNPETGQITYTLDKINDNKDTTEEQDTYLIDLDNEAISKKEAKSEKVIKENGETDANVVKDNLSNNLENKKIKRKTNSVRARKDPKKKETNKIVDENAPNTVGEDKVVVKDKKVPRKGRIAAKKPPPFTLDPGQKDCKLCETKFDTTKALSTHMNTHYPEFVCKECGMAFASERRLRTHGYQAHVDGPLACKYCDKQFTNANTRNAHMWRVHTKTDPYKCAQCGERFKTYLKRLRHMQSAHGNTVDYPCQYCDKKFAYAAYRTKHVRTVHLQERPHKCPNCPQTFARRRELDAHRASKHGEGELKYQCDICSQKFFFKTALRFHLNLHDNRYSCNHCDAKFSRISHLETHYKTHAPTHDLQCTDNFLPSLEPVFLDELTDYALTDSSFWVLNEL